MKASSFIMFLALFMCAETVHAQTIAGTASNNAGFITGNSIYNNGRTGAQIYYSPAQGANYGDPTQGALNILTGQQNIYQALQDRQKDFQTHNDLSGLQQLRQNQPQPQQSQPDQNAASNKTKEQTNTSPESDQSYEPKVMNSNSILEQAQKSGEEREKKQLETLLKIKAQLNKKQEEDNVQQTRDEKPNYFSGKAFALDGVTIVVSGRQIVLNDIKAPGNQQKCYKDAVPWDCGKEATKQMNTILSNEWVNCASLSDGKGICEINGDDVSYSMARTGFAIGTTPYTQKATKIAKESGLGLWQ